MAEKKRNRSSSVKLTANISVSVYQRFDDMYLDLRHLHRTLKRKDFLELVIDCGLDYSQLEVGIKRRSDGL